MNNVLESIYKNLSIEKDTILVPKWGAKPQVTIEQFMTAILNTESSQKAFDLCGRNRRSFDRNLKKLFPDVYLQGGGQTWKNYFLRASDYKYCSKCKILKSKTEFNKDSNNSDQLSFWCRECAKIRSSANYHENKEYFDNYYKSNRKEYRARAAKRRASLLQRTPKWSEEDEIREFYKNCPTGFHVDHFYPLQGETVSGLHVLGNLQYLEISKNLSKGNKHPDEFYGHVAKLVETRQT